MLTPRSGVAGRVGSGAAARALSANRGQGRRAGLSSADLEFALCDDSGPGWRSTDGQTPPKAEGREPEAVVMIQSVAGR